MKWNFTFLLIVAIIAGWLLWRSSEYDESKKQLFDKVSSDWNDEISYASSFFDVPKSLITAIICQESSGNPDAVGTSQDLGLMQVTPSAFLEFKDRYASDYTLPLGWLSDLMKPEINVSVGTGYLRILFDRFRNWDDAVQAYNTGTTGTRNSLDYLSKVKAFQNQQFF